MEALLDKLPLQSHQQPTFFFFNSFWVIIYIYISWCIIASSSNANYYSTLRYKALLYLFFSFFLPIFLVSFMLIIISSPGLQIEAGGIIMLLRMYAYGCAYQLCKLDWIHVMNINTNWEYATGDDASRAFRWFCNCFSLAQS